VSARLADARVPPLGANSSKHRSNGFCQDVGQDVLVILKDCVSIRGGGGGLELHLVKIKSREERVVLLVAKFVGLVGRGDVWSLLATDDILGIVIVGWKQWQDEDQLLEEIWWDGESVDAGRVVGGIVAGGGASLLADSRSIGESSCR
jgi:hypothetical protein